MSGQGKGRREQIIQKQLALRAQLWPDLNDSMIWERTKKDGFATIPRTMPIILQIMDDMSKTKPISSTYFELWCRAYDECFVTLSKSDEIAFHAGFSGQRALSTWRGRLKILHDLGFIDIKPGPNGQMSYALIMNPYVVIKKLHAKKHTGISSASYNALFARAIEIGAKDLN